MILQTGTQGSLGPTGATGSQGAQGTQGTQGSLGPTGATGAQGAQGTQGSIGLQGTQGSIGPTGADSTVPGPQGSQGSIGLQGTQGTQGSLGPTGATGAQGTQGSIGLQGTQGTVGSQGSQGSIGTNFLMNPSITTASGVTGVVPDISTTQLLDLINIASGMTIYLPSGTPNNGQYLAVRIRNTSATGYSITWATGTISATGYTAQYGATLPTRTNAKGRNFVEFIYDSTNELNKWVIISRAN